MKIIKYLDVTILIIISIITIIINVIDFFDLFSLGKPLFKIDYSIVMLVLLAFIGFHLGLVYLSNVKYQTDSELSLKQILKSVKTHDIRTFSDAVELETYLGKRILDARKEVCDLSWKSKISAGFSINKRKQSHDYYDKCIKNASEKILFREIFIFSDPRRFQKFKRRLSENKNGYSCRYYKDDSIIPRLQFVIIDDTEIVFFASSTNSLLCSIKSEELCRVLKPYYEEVWANAIPIKEGSQIHQDIVNEIFAKYS